MRVATFLACVACTSANSLYAYARRRATCRDPDGNPQLVLLYFDYRYTKLGLNAALSLRNVGCDCVALFVEDKQSKDMARCYGFEAFVISELQHVPADVRLDYVPVAYKPYNNGNPWQWQSRFSVLSAKENGTGLYGGFYRWPHWLLRHWITLQILHAGVSVFQSDVDSAFDRNPLQDMVNERHMDDVQGEPAPWPQYCGHFPTGCCVNLGIGYVRASQGGTLFWQLINSLMRFHGWDPQTLDNRMIVQLANTSGVWRQTPAGWVLSSQDISFRWFEREKLRTVYTHIKPGLFNLAIQKVHAVKLAAMMTAKWYVNDARCELARDTKRDIATLDEIFEVKKLRNGKNTPLPVWRQELVTAWITAYYGRNAAFQDLLLRRYSFSVGMIETRFIYLHDHDDDPLQEQEPWFVFSLASTPDEAQQSASMCAALLVHNITRCTMIGTSERPLAWWRSNQLPSNAAYYDGGWIYRYCQRLARSNRDDADDAHALWYMRTLLLVDMLHEDISVWSLDPKQTMSFRVNPKPLFMDSRVDVVVPVDYHKESEFKYEGQPGTLHSSITSHMIAVRSSTYGRNFFKDLFQAVVHRKSTMGFADYGAEIQLERVTRRRFNKGTAYVAAFIYEGQINQLFPGKQRNLNRNGARKMMLRGVAYTTTSEPRS